MFEWLAGIVESIWLFFQNVLFWMCDRVLDYWEWTKETVAFLVIESMGWVVSLLPAEWESQIMAVDYNQFVTYFNDTNWIIPIYPTFAIVGAVYGICATIRLVRQKLGTNLICGISNVSHGLPDRDELNAAFLTQAMAAGLTCAIANPLSHQLQRMVRAAEVTLGVDRFAKQWIRLHREGEAGGGVG